MSRIAPTPIRILSCLLLSAACSSPHTSESSHQADVECAGETPIIDVSGAQIGSFALEPVDDVLVLTISGVDGNRLKRFEAYVGAGPVPAKASGVVEPLAFPIVVETPDYPEQYQWRISLSELGAVCGDALVLSLHATFKTYDEDGEPLAKAVGWALGEIVFETFYPAHSDGYGLTYELCCDEEPEGCTLTQGYWKNHHDGAPGKRNVDWPAPHDEADQLCGIELLDILNTPVAGDKWLILAHQYIAAILNAANGASVPADVQVALDDAASILADCDGLDAEQQSDAVEASEILDSYNNGLAGPDHCDDAGEQQPSNEGDDLPTLVIDPMGEREGPNKPVDLSVY